MTKTTSIRKPCRPCACHGTRCAPAPPPSPKKWGDAAYEKGETQSFYNEFFEIFGVRRRTVASYEAYVAKLDNGLGGVEVRVPKVRSRSGSAGAFRSALVPPYVRRCASLDTAIPWRYLHGVHRREAVGEQAARGLSANVVSRLKRTWDEEYRNRARVLLLPPHHNAT